MNMKRLLYISFQILLVLALVLMLTPCNAPAAAKKLILRLGHPAATVDVNHISFEAWSKEVAKVSNGNIEVKIFPGSQLGGELEMVQQVSSGALDMVSTGNTGYDPLNGFYAPYAFTSPTHLHKVLDAKIRDPFFEGFRQKQGLRFLSYFERSPRNLTANKAIRTPADMKGVKIRVPQFEAVVNGWKAVGASVTPLAWPEVFQALQAGTVDAQENPVELIYSAKLYEVQKFMMTTEHGYPPFFIFINDKVWGGMTDEQRKVVQETLNNASIQHRARLAKSMDELTATLKAKGMQIVQPDRKAFRDIMWPQATRPFLVKAWGEDLVKKVEALAD